MQIDNLIIDGTNIEFRIFHIARKSQISGVDSDNNNNQAMITSNFLQTFLKLVEKFDPINIYTSWDKRLDKSTSNFRKKILVDQYKLGRIRPHDINDMYDQEIRLIEILQSFGVKNIFPNTLEADDVCAWLSHTLEGHSVVVSADSDLLQLVTPFVSVYNLKDLITFENFKEKKNIEVGRFVLYKAIMGDKSDNISGLDGYGEVYSRRLANNWDPTKLTQEQIDIVGRNLLLMDLKVGYVHEEGEQKLYENQFNYCKGVKCDFNKFIELCEINGLTRILANQDRWKRASKRNSLVEIINTLT